MRCVAILIEPNTRKAGAKVLLFFNMGKYFFVFFVKICIYAIFVVHLYPK